jgi:hypothetical protein
MEFAPQVAKLILGASLYYRSTGPNNSPQPPTHSTQALSDIRPLSLPATCVVPFRPWVPNYCANTRPPPGAAALPKTD